MKTPTTVLRALTPARIGIGRAGSGLPTAELLAFGLAHARARDAVHAALDVKPLLEGLKSLGFHSQEVSSPVPDRETSLRRTDLGRRLGEGFSIKRSSFPVGLVLADGLSSFAIQNHAIPLLRALVAVSPERWQGAPAVIALQARVALGDEIGERLGAQLVCVLIGERPGLSAHDSLGAYLTFAPRVGRTDAERNCISNIHRAGLSYDEAACRIAWLIREGLARQITGVALKDESGGAMPRRIAAEPDESDT